MADLNKIMTAETIIVTDGVSQEAGIATAIPATNAAGLVVREANQGQQLSANSQPVVLASDQSAIVFSLTDGQENTYSMCRTNQVVDSSTSGVTDVLEIIGSATKKVKITYILISGKCTNITAMDLQLVKRSTNNTGSTFTTTNQVPHNSSDPASTAVVKTWTTNPTALGTTVGNLRAAKVTIPPSPDSFVYEFDSGARPGTQCFTLLNANETLCVNFNSTIVAGGNFDYSVEWTEQ